MNNFKKIIITSVALISATSVLSAFEYTDRPPGTVTNQNTYSNPNHAPSTNPPGQTSTNAPGSSTINSPYNNPQNVIRENTIRQNSMPINQDNTSGRAWHRPNYQNMVAETQIQTHNGAVVDDDITQKIKWAVKNDKSLSDLGKGIQASTKNGEVTLSGKVKDASEKTKIEADVKQIDGVKKVHNKLTTQ